MEKYSLTVEVKAVAVAVKAVGEPEVEILPAGEAKAVVKYEDGKVKIVFDRIDISATVIIKQVL